MEISRLYNDYLENKCEEVWKEISFFDYDSAGQDDKKILDLIINTALSKIDQNFRTIISVLDAHDFNYENYGLINQTNQTYLVRNNLDASNTFQKLLGTSDDHYKLPVFFAAFCSYFKVVDFRGAFKDIEPAFLLDQLFIESYDSYKDAEECFFNIEFIEHNTVSCFFSPDQYFKENISGSLGLCIIVDENRFVDNYVANFASKEKITFIEYLRFCMEWACMPNLFLAEEIELRPYVAILDEVRSKLLVF